MHELRLCLALGLTRGRLRREMDSLEYGDWLAYSQQYGFPSERSEVGVALAGCVVANSMGAKVRPKQLLPGYEDTQRVSAKQGIKLLRARINAHEHR